MQIEVSSFFNKGVWKPVDLETFRSLVGPVDEIELADMLDALKAGQCVLSVLGVSKFRAVKDKRFTEFTIMIDKTSFGELLLIQTNERNEAYIDDDEIEALIFFLRDFQESKKQPPDAASGEAPVTEA